MKNSDQAHAATIEHLLTVAESGDPLAQHSLASRFATGRGVEKDESAAFFWYCQACSHGLAEAKFNAGTMLINGEGIEKNVELGIRLIQEAAEHGENNACVFISLCHARGAYGKTADKNASEAWHLKSLEQADAVFSTPFDIQSELGICLAKPDIKISPC